MEHNPLLEKAHELYIRAQELEGQLQVVRDQLIQFTEFQKNLSDFEKTKEKRMLAPLGKGLFVSADVASKELWVDVGANVIVKKNIAETQEIIMEQMKRLHEMREPLEEELADLGEQLTSLSSEIERKPI